jgi:hypothetical protein
MTDLITNICALRLEQKESRNLLPPQQITKWITQAESRISYLKLINPAAESDEYMEADCLISNLDEIQDMRANIIWDDAFDGAGDISLMTVKEAAIYRILSDKACELRGEA